MKLIVGLGNPGLKYEKTRHNAGFMALDILAKSLDIEINQNKFNSLIATYKTKDETIILMKPQTFMNLSGEAVLACVQFYKMSFEDVIVVHDDLDIPNGKIRLRAKGSAGGQKGLANIINLLKSQDIKRIKIGIGKSAIIPVVDYVLGKITEEDLPEFNKSLEKTAKALKFSFTNDFDKVMNRYNG